MGYITQFCLGQNINDLRIINENYNDNSNNYDYTINIIILVLVIMKKWQKIEKWKI